MKKKILKILGYIVLGIIIVLLGFFVWARYEMETGQLVKWDGEWYTKEELEEKYPPQQYDIEAKNTPEEVYSKFREALLNNNKEKALKFIVEDKKDLYREAFNNKNKYKEWLERLPKKINKENIHGNHASYYYLNEKDSDDNIAHPINFVKTNKGYWKIDSI